MQLHQRSLKSLIRFELGCALALASASLASAQSPTPEVKVTVSSPSFQADGNIPDQFGCKGANVNPPLQFRGFPAETKSLVLVVDDPDAPGVLFTHWLVWNIDPATTKIGERSVPAGAIQGTNDFGNVGYGGPCPPSGTHRYFFRIFALDQALDLKSGAKRRELNEALAGHVLAHGELMARSSR
ncbi:MAG: YbhB/YbcL family Raf kinase inhibitor-like protein [Nitrospirota bacterium]